MIASGRLAKLTIKGLGERGHTTFANLATAAALLLWGFQAKRWNVWLALGILLFGMERRSCTTSRAGKHAELHGIGAGEFSAAFSSLRALAVIFAPVMYSQVYKRAGKSFPGAPYWCGAAVALLAEAMIRSLDDSSYYGRGPGAPNPKSSMQ